MKVTKLIPQIKTENEIQVKKAARNALASEALPPKIETDRVELSHGSKEVQKMQEILQHTPEVRAEKVQDLKARVERGEYRVEAREIATRMLDDLLVDDLTGI